MKLANDTFLQLQAALLDGYDRSELRRMVRLGHDESLAEISTASSDQDVVFDLIEWAMRKDRIPDLITAAAAYNEKNAALQALALETKAWPGPPTGALTQNSAHARAGSEPKNSSSYEAGGDIIIGSIGSGASNVALGKNIRQSSSTGKKAQNAKGESGTKALCMRLKHIFFSSAAATTALAPGRSRASWQRFCLSRRCDRGDGVAQRRLAPATCSAKLRL